MIAIRFPKKLVFPLIILIVVLACAGTSYFFYNKYQKTQKLLKDPTAAQQAEIKDVTSKVSKLMDLPQGEDPSVATVLDKEKLKDQLFFARTENGDKVIIYTKAQKAILYRPSTNKIIEVAPINLGASSLPIPVVLYNGTTTTGLTSALEKELKDTVSGVTVVDKANAKRTDYAKTIVVDLVGTRATEAKQLAGYLGGEVGQLPAGEVKPADATKAELLIIVGKNYTAVKTIPATASPSASPSASPTP